MEGCIFCKIVKGEVKVDVLYEDELALAFADVAPIAPVHILIIPKKHIENIAHLPKSEKDERMMGRLISIARDLAEKNGIAKDGYKLLFRVGENGGQEIPHIHLHLIGGAKLSEGIHPC
ncbi:histidine triad nucleotide-binding protein [bacterium]|jgi:histidine triad (HIT) family protein|nr:histidine triad nucleotide-binding protein [bacterium]MBT4251002.1 histidine triad nucleotide-binding protein [bacterium]MBT4597766.1 histidine triad nucleotide-binding protein [bacterium]MBT6753861.1 histidine triad nucleotide-binding protein [bacterium]MBT7037427.1 histidine triad nucleotide-binding protein [bacterium]